MADAAGRIRVLYDGWALTYAPSSPAALHLLALLSALPPGVEALLALPGPTSFDLPAPVRVLTLTTAGAAWNHLTWEQRSLPRLAHENQAQMVHLFGSHPPLSSPIPVVVSPAESQAGPLRPRQVAERLRAALAAGAASSLRALLWPDDLDPPSDGPSIYRLPPLAHPAFSTPTPPPGGAAEGCVLYHGALDEPTLLRLLEGWGWVSGVLGDFNPLVLAGLTPTQTRLVERLIAEGDFGASVQILAARTAEDWAALYAAAALVISLGLPPVWGGALTDALAAGKALVAWEDPISSRRVGPAGYLTPPGDGRALGAAISTLVVEPEMAESMGQRARERSAAWHSQSFGARLIDAYRKIIAV